MRALTPTSAGFAQVFDSSQAVNSIIAMRRKREEALSKSLMDYDPTSVWKRDIPELSKRVKQYREFVSSNHDKLLQSSENTETWVQKKAMEDEIKYFIAGSKQAQDDYNTSLRRYHGDKRFQTPENQELLYNFSHPETWTNPEEQYSTLSAFDASPLQNMKMNVMLDSDAIVNGMKSTVKTIGGETTKVGGKTLASELVYDEQAYGDYLKFVWDKGAGKNDALEIRNKYNDDFDLFKEDMDKLRPKYTKPIDVTERATSSGSTKKQVPAVASNLGTASRVSSAVQSTTDDGSLVKGSMDVANHYNITFDPIKNIPLVGVIPTYYLEGGKFDETQAEKGKTLTITGKMLAARAKVPLVVRTLVSTDQGDKETEVRVNAGDLLPSNVISAQIETTKKVKSGLFGTKEKEETSRQEVTEASYNDYIDQFWAAKGQISLQEGGLDMSDVGYSATQIGVKGGTKSVIIPWDEIEGSISNLTQEWADKGFSLDEKMRALFPDYEDQKNVRVVKFTNKTFNNSTTPDATTGKKLTEEDATERLKRLGIQ